MDVSQLVSAAFIAARAKYRGLSRTWNSVSWKIGGRLPNSLLTLSVQRIGEIDLVLRCMEDEADKRGASETEEVFRFNCKVTLSEIWVGSAYEIMRLLKERRFAPNNDDFDRLAHDFRLLRVPLEKHEIAGDRKLKEPLQLVKHPPRETPEAEVPYEYVKGDPTRAHIMPTGLSGRGSLMWQVVDVGEMRQKWLERREMSDRFISLWDTGHGGT